MSCHRIILKSNCPVPIDVWLVSGIHKEQRHEMQQPDGDPQTALAALAAEGQAEMHAPGKAAGLHSQPSGTKPALLLLCLRIDDMGSHSQQDLPVSSSCLQM